MMITEQKILLCAACMDPDENQLGKLHSCMSTAFDPDRLIDRALHEGLGGFLYRNLLKADVLKTLKDVHQQRLYTNYYLTVRHNLKLMHALNTILAQLQKEKIWVVLLPGISLLHQVYQDIGLRPMKNMDLWVLPNDFQRLVNTLVGLGFKNHPSFPDTFKKGAVAVNIQSGIPWTDRVASGDNLHEKQQTEIFNDAFRIHVDGRKVLCLSPQDHFLYLGWHALRRNLERLVWLVDIKSLISEWDRSDWEVLVNRAEGPVHETTLFPVLSLLKSIFKIEFPAAISSRLGSWEPNFATKMVLHRRLNGRSARKWTRHIHLPVGIGFRDGPFSFMKKRFSWGEGLK